MALDIERVRGDTPGCSERIHFNNAGASLPPKQVVETVIRHLRLESQIGGYEAADAEADRIRDVYASTARLLNCDPDEVALLENATRAWDAVFYAVPLQAGDRIVTGRSEYCSNYMALLDRARKTGAEVVVVDDDESGQIDLAELSSVIDRGAKLVSLTHVPTSGGLVNPAAAVGAIARRGGALFLLDACQSVGQMPIDVKAIGCDFLATTGRKFLRGPRGTGLLFVSRRSISQLEPAMVEVGGARWSETNAFSLHGDAKRFETWEASYALQLGLGRAIDYALKTGLVSIWERVQTLAEALRANLGRVPGLTVHEIGAIKCAIVTFTVDGLDSNHLCRLLRSRSINVDVSTAEDSRLDFEARGLRPMIRASIHYFNTIHEIEQFVEEVQALTKTAHAVR